MGARTCTELAVVDGHLQQCKFPRFARASLQEGGVGLGKQLRGLRPGWGGWVMGMRRVVRQRPWIPPSPKLRHEGMNR